MPDQHSHTQSVVHWFDTVEHRVACGAAAVDRSTKHVRAVNCPTCLELLRRGALHHAPADDGAHVS